MSNTTAQHNEVFERARDEFLASLSPAEKIIFDRCPSAEALISNVEKMRLAKKDARGHRAVITVLGDLSNSLKPYFDTIGIFVQSHPEYAAMIWGAFHLVFKLADNHESFFRRLTTTLGRITELLPHYNEIAVKCKTGPSLRLQSSLCKVYEDLLLFCQSIVRVFTKDDGKAKRSVRVTTSLLWKPFDARFEELLDNFRFHASFVKSELLLLDLLETKQGKDELASQIQSVKAELRRLDRVISSRNTNDMTEQSVRDLEKRLSEARRDKVYNIQQWINPPSFAQEFERARDHKEPGTAEWLLSEDLVNRWLQSSTNSYNGTGNNFDERTVWIQGNPGCGKTILAASTVEELTTVSQSPGSEYPVIYFFFRAGYRDFEDPISLSQSLLAQIFHAKRDDGDIIDKFAFIMDENSLGQLHATRSVMVELFQLCVTGCGTVLVVVDGIDESSEPEAVVEDLLLLTRETNVKLLLFSRPNVSALYNSVLGTQCLNVRDKNNKDIETYAISRLKEMVEDDMLPSHLDTSDLVEHLSLGANGMFLWIRLMTSFLNSPALTRRQRSEAVLNITVPEGIDIERDLARRVFAWLIHCKRPLTVRELRVAVSQETTMNVNDEDDFVDFRRAVILSCSGLVEAQRLSKPAVASSVDSFQFIHLSAKKFLLSEMSDVAKGSPDEQTPLSRIMDSRQKVIMDIATRCLVVLACCLPAQPLSGSPDAEISRATFCDTFPFLEYVVCFWIDHLRDTQLEACIQHQAYSEVLKALARFLSLNRTIMAYIEASYVLGIVPPTERLDEWSQHLKSRSVASQIESSLLSNVLNNAEELSRYLGALQKEWSAHLLHKPKAIWEDVTAFTTSRLIEQTGKTQVRTLIMDPPEVQSRSSRYLSKISEMSEDGKTVAILSIWPSKDFETSAQSSMTPIASMLHTLCNGWVARYELWTVADDPSCIADGCIPLDADEVHLQIQRSIWQFDPSYSHGYWKIQFPTAISPDTSVICIIRTVYAFTVTKSNEAKMHTTLLPLHLYPALRNIWPPPPGLQGPADVAESAGGSQDKSKSGFRKSISGLLKPGTSHRRSRSLPKEEDPSCKKTKNESSRLHMWSKSFTRSRTPEGRSSAYQRRYKHSISFAHHGAFLLFVDHVDGAAQNNIALFGVDTKGHLKLSFVKTTREVCCQKLTAPPPKVVCHPRSSLLAFYFPKVSGLSRVMLWNFSRESNAVLEVYQTSEFGPETIEDVHFSRDGDHLVIQISSSEAPEVVSIDPRLFSAEPSINGAENQDSHPVSNTITADPSPGPSIQVSGAAGPAQFEPTTSVASNGSASGTNIVHTSSQITIRKWSGSGEGLERQTKAEVLRLTRLPAWDSSNPSSVAISAPQAGDDRVRVVLNKSARPWDDMVQDVDVHLPALVSKDMASLEIEDDGGQLQQAGNVRVTQYVENS
ncbi:hypothetical protein OPT61_g2995 [Boeremia exigua]|uniref:Uncharacterized protein n=1 Tax=Boeremia exigua TaxID=749465 RepID=A0ACC2IJJ6_9PLEO|nr:hypothetical protein OPT61_g2995 [Boeremia exigua]